MDTTSHSSGCPYSAITDSPCDAPKRRTLPRPLPVKVCHILAKTLAPASRIQACHRLSKGLTLPLSHLHRNPQPQTLSLLKSTLGIGDMHSPKNLKKLERQPSDMHKTIDRFCITVHALTSRMLLKKSAKKKKPRWRKASSRRNNKNEGAASQTSACHLWLEDDTVRAETPSDLIHPTRKIEFESCK